jgi:hypothetical protein
MNDERSTRDRKAPLRPIEVPHMELAYEGSRFLAEQLVDSYHDSLDTKRLPAVRFDHA